MNVLDNAPKTPVTSEEVLKKTIQAELQEAGRAKIKIAQILQKICEPELAATILEGFETSSSEKAIEKREIESLALLWQNWDEFQAMCKHLARTTTKKIYDLKDVSGFGQLFKAYQRIMRPEKGQHVLPGKTADEREDALYELAGILRTVLANGQKLLEEQQKKSTEEQARLLNEMKETAEQKNKEIAQVMNTIRKEVATVQNVPEYLWGVDEEHREHMLGLMGKNDQIEEYFRTCFDPQVIESKNFEEISTESNEWKKLIKNPGLLPEVPSTADAKKILKEVWEKDREKRKKYYEVTKVRKSMEEIERKTMGADKLSHKNRLNTDGERFERDITWGKFMEKVFCLLSAEKWKEDQSVKVIPVDSNLDIYGKIDLLLEVTNEKGQKFLVAYDYTIQKDPRKKKKKDGKKTEAILYDKDQTTKDMRPQILVKLNIDSAKKMLSKEILDLHPEILRGESVIIPREVRFNPIGMNFRETLLRKLYETIKKSPEASHESGTITKIYRETRTTVQDGNGEPVEELTRIKGKESKDSAISAA
jgi:hypothetical protein